MNTPQDRRRPLAALVATGLCFTLLVAAAGFAVRVLAVSLSGQHPDVSAAELARLYMLGLRFDLKFAGTVLAGVWALALLWLAWPRAFAAYAWAGLVVLAGVQRRKRRGHGRQNIALRRSRNLFGWHYSVGYRGR